MIHKFITSITLLLCIVMGLFYVELAQDHITMMRAITHLTLTTSFDRMLPMQKVTKGPEVTVTTYNSTVAQTDSTPHITAFNMKPTSGTIAISRDLMERGFKPKQRVYLEGLGTFIVADLMNKRFTNRVDIWLPLGVPHFKVENVKTALILD